jgi:Pectate lyase superfamily protein
MKRVCQLLLLLTCLPAMAATYTFTAPHLTMHAGDLLPPLVFNVSAYSGSYASHFSGEPSRSTLATSSSAPGNYPITISRGSLQTVDREDSLRFVNGTLTIIPADGIGAHLTNDIAYPPGFLSGPPEYAAVDVTKNSTANLVGDCVTDNAGAFSVLLSQNGTRNSATTNGGSNPLYLYFPPGCYATSQPLTIYGNTWTFWGSGPQKSFIRLLPNSPAFNTGTAAQFFSPLSVNRNSNFREYINNLGFNIGAGNPDAIPFTTVQNNSGAVRNVQIWSDDSNCPYAISLHQQYPGPMLFKNVAVYGCKNAYSSRYGEYNITFEDFTTEAQTVTVLDNHFIKASIRHWLSDNTVQALHAYGSAIANVVVLDSKILNGDSTTPGITVEKGCAVYLQNVIATGYSPTEIDAGGGTPVIHTGNIEQAWTGTGQSLFNYEQSPDSLHLAVQETPAPNDPPVSQWTRLGAVIANWPALILNSASTTVYVPPGIYSGTGTTHIVVPDKITHLEFYQAKFPTSSAQIVLTVDGSSSRPLTIDGCLYKSCQIVHTGSRAIVVRDSTLYSYAAQNGAGDLYVEDSNLSSGEDGSIAINFYPSQHIWARQLNLEQNKANKFNCSGCRIWMLGYKTEQATPSIVLTDGAQAEVLGFFFYQNVPPTREGTANIYLTDSSLFATGWTQVDRPGYGQPNWVIERQGSTASSLPTRDVNTPRQLNMFYSYGGAGTPVRRDPTRK